MQLYTVYLIYKLFYMLRVVSTPIIKSTNKFVSCVLLYFSCVYCCSCLVCNCCSCLCVLLSSYVYLLYCVCIAVFILYAGLLARSQYSEGPATGHLDTGFS